MNTATKKPPVVRQEEANEFTRQIEDPCVRTAVDMALARTVLAIASSYGHDGTRIAPLETSETLDFLFLAKLYFEIFSRKRMVVDILTGQYEEGLL